MLGIGAKPTKPGQIGTAPMPSEAIGSTSIANPRELSTEFQKHILDINPMQLAFYKVFSGWREITEEVAIELYGKKKYIQKTNFIIDPLGRTLNESGANMLFTEIVPLIFPGGSTSHLKPIQIYDLWNGHLMTISTSLLDSYFIPQYICNEEKCRFLTPSKKAMQTHVRMYKHKTYDEIVNPYELNIMKHANIITFLCTLSIVTNKAKDGFTLRELAESFMTQQVIRNGLQGPVEQQPGLLQRITGR